MTRGHHTLPHRLSCVDAHFSVFCFGLLPCSSSPHGGELAGAVPSTAHGHPAYRAFSYKIYLEAERTTDFGVFFCFNKSHRPVLVLQEVGETS
jgi:hypothetical protein